MFNALKYTEELEKVGFSREQAEKSINILIEIMNDNFATKHDLKDLENKMVAEFKSVRSEVNELRQEVSFRFKDLENRMTIKLGSMLVITVGVMTAIQKLV